MGISYTVQLITLSSLDLNPILVHSTMGYRFRDYERVSFGWILLWLVNLLLLDSIGDFSTYI